MDMTDLIPKFRTGFVRVKCGSCGNEQTIFSAASRSVNCLVCNSLLAKPGASNIVIKTKKAREI